MYNGIEMPQNLLKKNNQNQKLTIIDKTIIKFIEVDPFSVLNLSIEDFAKQCYTTKSTVVKTLKKIGISGYKELKNKIILQIKSLNKEKEGLDYSQETINNIKATELHLKDSQITKAAAAIAKSKKVIIIGGGSIHYIGAILSDQLNKMGIRSESFEIQNPAVMSTDADIVIFISNSGVNEFIYKKAEFFNKRKDKDKPSIISVTASNTTNIKNFINYHLPGSRLFSISKKEYDMPTVSISIIWFIIQNLVKEIYSIIKKDNMKYI